MQKVQPEAQGEMAYLEPCRHCC